MSLDTPINEEILAAMNGDADFVKTPDAVVDGIVSSEVTDDFASTPDVQEAIDAISSQSDEASAIQDGAVKAGEMKDVADRVMATESISIVDAEEVQRVYGGLEEAVAPVAAYSEAPTKTNLVPTQRYVANKLADETNQVLVRHLNYVNATYGSAKKLLELLIPQYAELFAEFEAVRARATEDLAKASVSQRFKACTKGEKGEINVDNIVDMKAVCLYNQDFAIDYHTDSGVNASLPTREETSAFRAVYFSNTFKKLFRSADRNSRDPLIALHRAFHNDSDDDRSYSSGVSYIDLLTLFSSGKIEYLLTVTLEEVKKVSLIIDAEYAKLTAADAEIIPWSQEFRDSTLNFSDYYESLLQLEKYRMVTKMFIYRALPIIEGFGSLL